MAKLITDYPVETDVSLYVTSVDGSPKGWRVDLLEEKLSSKLEEKLLLCSCCKGLLRDACICNGAFMCQVCIPEDTALQPVEMNREIVNERKVIVCYTYTIASQLISHTNSYQLPTRTKSTRTNDNLYPY